MDQKRWTQQKHGIYLDGKLFLSVWGVSDPDAAKERLPGESWLNAHNRLAPLRTQNRKHAQKVIDTILAALNSMEERESIELWERMGLTVPVGPYKEN